MLCVTVTKCLNGGHDLEERRSVSLCLKADKGFLNQHGSVRKVKAKRTV